MQEHHFQVTRTARYVQVEPTLVPPRSLWIVLHGYGQLADDFMRDVEVLDDGSRLIVAPEALSRFYLRMGQPRVGASWMTREDRLQEIDDYIRYLDELHDHVQARLDGERLPLNVLAFSQGASTACRWLTLGRTRAQRLILWGGEVPPDLDLEAHAATLREADLTMVMGLQDVFITEERRAHIMERLAAYELPIMLHTYDGLHRIEPDVLYSVVTDGESEA